ncbi:MAG: sensor histidine kinase [Sumerlaeia bacterium]
MPSYSDLTPRPYINEITPSSSYNPEKLGRLLRQVRWVTRISVALSSAATVDDIYSVLVSGLLSPMGLSYTHTMLFELDESKRVMRGKYSCGYESKSQMQALREDLERDANYLEQRRIQLQQKALENNTEAIRELQVLNTGSQWVSVFQQLSIDNEDSHVISNLELPQPKNDNPEEDTLLSFLERFQNPILLTQGQRKALKIPAELENRLAPTVAIVPLRVKKKIRAILILDRELNGEQIDDDDMEALDWYATQGSLALQNCLLIHDLEHAYEELKAVDTLKSNFLSILSHELRTPLTAITGFVELILHDKVGEINQTQRNLLTRVSKNTGHLNNMVNDLIEIAEIESEGMTDLTLSPIDPLTTLYATLPKLEYRRRDTTVEIEPVFIGQIKVPAIICDEGALERIFFHLLDNAVKFSPTNAPVRVEFEIYDKHNLSISICDKGKGIPPDKVQRIFDEFYQIDNTLTRSHEGLGLGLTVTKFLVQSTKGEIKVNSIEDEGSRFTLIYPLAEPVADESNAHLPDFN